MSSFEISSIIYRDGIRKYDYKSSLFSSYWTTNLILGFNILLHININVFW